MTVPEETLPSSTPLLQNITNFRDVALSINAHHPQPRLHPRLLYRSARPDEASPSDRHALLSHYRVKTVIDLRSKTEHIEQAQKHSARLQKNNKASAPPTADEPPRIPGLNYEEISLNSGAFSRALLWRLSWTSLAKLLTLMAAGYRTDAIAILGREVMAPRGLIGLGKDTLDYSRWEICQVFSILADADRYPVLVHCTQGKDRTGLVVILLLLLLGVDVQAIREDYVASEKGLVGEMEERMKEIGRIGLGSGFAGCPEGFVEEIRGYIDEKYGGIATYLDGCGVNEEMREIITAKLLLQ